MSVADYAVSEASVLGDEVLSWGQLDHWVLIGGLMDAQIQMDTLSIEESGDGIARMRVASLNPVISIVEGKTVEVVWRGVVIFGGIIRTLTVDADQSEALFMYGIEADGWDALLARHLITASYTNQAAGDIIADAISTSGLDLDGVTTGFIDHGIMILQVESDHVRASEFIRDIGIAGGGIAYIDPYKRIVFRPSSVDISDVLVNNDRAETIQHMSDIDNYRNRQIVRVTGTGGNVVTETRDDLAQQALRIADEGGSGIYEDFETVTHPTSDVTGELSILGQTVGYVKLRTYSRNARRITVRMRDPAPRIGQLTTLELPEFGISGSFLAMRKTWSVVANAWLFSVEFWESSFQQLALESLLRLVGAGKADISISAGVFPNVQIFSTPGTFTWTVPTGITSAQFTAYGGSGAGGEGNCSIGGPFSFGGKGGASGKAVTIAVVVPAQVYDIVVGAKGTVPGGHADGNDGTDSVVSLSAVVVCQGDLSTGGDKVILIPSCAQGADGIDGGGTGDAVSVGGGRLGGLAGTTTLNAQPGLDGLVEVRW